MLAIEILSEMTRLQMKGMIDGQRNEILFMGSSSPHMFEFMMAPLLPSESNGEIPKYYSWDLLPLTWFHCLLNRTGRSLQIQMALTSNKDLVPILPLQGPLLSLSPLFCSPLIQDETHHCPNTNPKPLNLISFEVIFYGFDSNI